MTVGLAAKFSGDFSDFDAPAVGLNFKGDVDLAANILKEADTNNILALPQMHTTDTYNLDHGALVPLYYLTREIGTKSEIVSIGYSFQTRAEHFSFGQIIQKVAEKTSQRIAIIASGDLSHKHLNNQCGDRETPKNFDNLIKNGIENNDFEKIIYADEELQEIAGECGYRSLLILLGSIDGLRVHPEVLSYEHPFGVGYLVADFGVEA
jgi:AmmeMemoRadiSam system protein B